MKKRGLSSVVTTVLFILLVLASIIIIWVAVAPVIFGTGGEFGSGQISARLEILDAVVVGSNLNLDVRRHVGEGDLVAIVAVVEDLNGDAVNHQEDSTITEFETESFSVDINSLGNLEKVTVYPVLLTSGGQNTIGGISDSYSFGGASSGGGAQGIEIDCSIGTFNADQDGATYVLNGNMVNVPATCISVTADNVVIDGQGFSVSTGAVGARGVDVVSVSDIIVKNIDLDGFGRGVSFDTVVGSSLIQSVTARNSNGNGIVLVNSNGHMIVDYQAIEIGGRGIELRDSSGTEILNSQISINSASGYGIYLRGTITGSQNTHIHDNVIEGGNHGIYAVQESHGSIIEDNEINYVITLDAVFISTDNNVFQNNIVVANPGDVDMVTFVGDFGEPSDNNQIVGNTITGGAKGLRLENGNGNYFSDNIIDGTTVGGISIEEDTSGNTFVNNPVANSPLHLFIDSPGSVTGPNTFIDSVIGPYDLGPGGLLSFENSDGRIEFLDPIIGSGSNLHGTGTSRIRITPNLAFVGGSSGLNRQANVILNDVPAHTNPEVKRNGASCPSGPGGICNFNLPPEIGVPFDANFHVTGWTTYEIGEVGGFGG